MSKINVVPGIHIVLSPCASALGRWKASVWNWSSTSLDVVYGSTRKEVMKKGRKLARKYRLMG